MERHIPLCEWMQRGTRSYDKFFVGEDEFWVARGKRDLPSEPDDSVATLFVLREAI